jgi:hypothetical protein
MSAQSAFFGPQDPFLSAFRGSFVSALRWPQLDALWERVDARADLGWYLYAVGELPPEHPVGPEQLRTFVAEIDRLLRTEHRESFCGIVYSDNPSAPSMIKIYDPHQLGGSCGGGGAPPLPGWVMSLVRPCDLSPARVLPGGRRRWWRALFD